MNRKPEPYDFPPESPHDLEWGGYNAEKYDAAIKRWNEISGVTPEEKKLFERYVYRDMTKEEILGEGGDACEYGWDLKVIPYHTAIKAMDIHSKVKSIGFLEWAISEGWQPYDGHDRWILGSKVLETKNLYDEYQKQLV